LEYGIFIGGRDPADVIGSVITAFVAGATGAWQS
jgi:hypothetical protein